MRQPAMLNTGSTRTDVAYWGLHGDQAVHHYRRMMAYQLERSQLLGRLCDRQRRRSIRGMWVAVTLGTVSLLLALPTLLGVARCMP